MKKTYVKSAIVSLGILTTPIVIIGQTGTGAGGGAAAQAGTAGIPSGLNAQGAANNTTQQTTTPPIGGGGSTVIGTPPIVVGGSVSGNNVLSAPNAGAALNLQSVPVASLPVPVQTALRTVGANGHVESVTQIQGLNGPIYRAQVTQNGTPVELQISQTGQVLSRTAGLVTPGSTVNSTPPAALGTATIGTAQAGLPVNSLPPAVQNGIQSQLGGNGQVQTVSRDDLVNGTVYRVTMIRNGIPTEMRFAANGTLLGSAPLNGALTSAFTPAAGTLLPGNTVVLSDLPVGVQSTIRSQIGAGRLTQITQQQGTNGLTYLATYDLDGRPMLMTVGPDGRVLNNTPMAGVGAAGAHSVGTGASTNLSTRTNATTRTSMKLDELPSTVEQTLKRTAPLAEVRTITREQRVGGDVYTIAIRDQNTVGDLVIDSDGRIVSDNRRDFAALSVPPPVLDDEKVSGMPFNTVPVAIQTAIKAYATASDIRSITLGRDRDGRTVYDVIYYHDGKRDRLLIAKDGTVRRVEQNVSPALEIPDPKKQPVIAMGDLPQAVQDTIRHQTENVLVKDITTQRVGSETVYQVHYQTNGAPVELLVATDGRVVFPEGTVDREASGAPLQASVQPDDLARANVVNASTSNRDSGTAAAPERGSRNSELEKSNTVDPASVTRVDLADVPLPVQNTAKKLAGSATIDSISPRLRDSGVSYEVAFMQNGTHKTVLVNQDGAIEKVD